LLSTIFCLSPLFGQVDAETVGAKYGPPIEATFDVRPGITMSVSYGDKHQICKLDIRPNGNVAVIPVALIVDILDEVVPPFIRGVPLQAAVMGACCSSVSYEKMTITTTGLIGTPNPNGPQSAVATVQFKSCLPPK
jgi:hypothetical protein